MGRIPKRDVEKLADEIENFLMQFGDIDEFNRLMPLLAKELYKRHVTDANPREGQSKGADHV